MKTEIDKIQENVGELYDSQSRKLFEAIVGMGAYAFSKKGPLYKFRDTNLIDKIIAHFEEMEEYEKCAELQKISLKLKDVK